MRALLAFILLLPSTVFAAGFVRTSDLDEGVYRIFINLDHCQLTGDACFNVDSLPAPQAVKFSALQSKDKAKTDRREIAMRALAVKAKANTAWSATDSIEATRLILLDQFPELE
jgi:hypothetical protein